MKTKWVSAIAGVVGVAALMSACYCFWLMDNPLSYRWVPVVVSGFLLAIFVFILSSIISIVAFVKLRRVPGAWDPSAGQPEHVTRRPNRQ